MSLLPRVIKWNPLKRIKILFINCPIKPFNIGFEPETKPRFIHVYFINWLYLRPKKMPPPVFYVRNADRSTQNALARFSPYMKLRTLCSFIQRLKIPVKHTEILCPIWENLWALVGLPGSRNARWTKSQRRLREHREYKANSSKKKLSEQHFINSNANQKSTWQKPYYANTTTAWKKKRENKRNKPYPYIAFNLDKFSFKYFAIL